MVGKVKLGMAAIALALGMSSAAQASYFEDLLTNNEFKRSRITASRPAIDNGDGVLAWATSGRHPALDSKSEPTSSTWRLPARCTRFTRSRFRR